MPKSLFSYDPFAAAIDNHRCGRKPASALLLLLLPALGLALVAFGMQARPGAGVSPMTMDTLDKPNRCESKAGLVLSIEEARRNVLYWQRESSSSTATPRSRAKMCAWEHGYRQRLALFARMYPKRITPK